MYLPPLFQDLRGFSSFFPEFNPQRLFITLGSGLEPRPKGWTGTEWPGRKPGAYLWYEIQDPIEYWQEFDKPKIVYQEIQFHPCFALDERGDLGNNKIFFIPCGDLYLLSLLNSPLIWWHNFRYLPHMKDESVSPVGVLMERLPVAEPSVEIREGTEYAARRLIELTDLRRSTTRDLLDWLRVEHAIDEPNQKLQSALDLDCDPFVAEVRKLRGKKNPLSLAAHRSLKEEHARTILPAQALAREALALERTISDLVNEAYGLTPEEVALMWETAPPRMPISKP